MTTIATNLEDVGKGWNEGMDKAADILKGLMTNCKGEDVASCSMFDKTMNAEGARFTGNEPVSGEMLKSLGKWLGLAEARQACQDHFKAKYGEDDGEPRYSDAFYCSSNVAATSTRAVNKCRYPITKAGRQAINGLFWTEELIPASAVGKGCFDAPLDKSQLSIRLDERVEKVRLDADLRFSLGKMFEFVTYARSLDFMYGTEGFSRVAMLSENADYYSDCGDYVNDYRIFFGTRETNILFGVAKLLYPKVPNDVTDEFMAQNKLQIEAVAKAIQGK